MRAAIDVLRLTFAWERLGPVGAPAASRREPRRLLRMLLAIEPLPLDPPAPARPQASSLAALFRRETLPLDPEPPPRARRAQGVTLRSLLAPEPLPLDPVPTPSPRRPRSRLAALFAPESLDDP